ncbi:MAG TPA: gamma-glutamyltransferase [Burkholderiaceae bacterium]|nr:gamma-glutamyltransferase [Burkholderiaceae bacterium]
MAVRVFQRLRHGVAFAAPFAALLVACSAAPDRPSQPEASSAFRPGLSTVTGVRHMAASANPLATEAGREILRAGGSAVDAAIAIQLVLGLVEPQSSGLGGGAFLMHWDGKRVVAYDGRETAPMAADDKLFLSPDGKAMPFYEAVIGGRSVGTPGAVRLLDLAHRQHGRLPWARLFEPALRLADNGFAMSPRLNMLLASEKYLKSDAAAAAYFYLPDGTPKAVGTLVRNPAYAATLRAIQAGGAEAFYNGAIPADIVKAVRSHRTGGLLAESDFAHYRVYTRDPICTDYRRWRVCGMPPPSSGGVAVAQMLGLFAVRNIAVVPPVTVNGKLEPQPDAVHLFSEAGRLAFADRGQYLADSDFVPVNVAGLVDPAYLRQRAQLIGDRSMGTAKPGVPPGTKSAFAPDRSPPKAATSHISVVDSFGNALSMTTTIEDVFGSRVMVRGFLLNNQLTDFSFVPQADGLPVANRVQPGKRPRSSMAPTLVFDKASGHLVATVGSPGGSQIIGYVTKTLVGIMDWNLDVQQAISLPNFGSRNGPTEVEKGQISSALVDGLKARGHDVREIDMGSGLQGIVRVRLPDGRMGWSGGADPRREGIALGD